MLAMWREADDIDLFQSGWKFDHFYRRPNHQPADGLTHTPGAGCMLWVELHAEFVVAAADVLDECVRH
jgi:hypothetical protein